VLVTHSPREPRPLATPRAQRRGTDQSKAPATPHPLTGIRRPSVQDRDFRCVVSEGVSPLSAML
jgi:hypothetical protein